MDGYADAELRLPVSTARDSSRNPAAGACPAPSIELGVRGFLLDAQRFELGGWSFLPGARGMKLDVRSFLLDLPSPELGGRSFLLDAPSVKPGVRSLLLGMSSVGLDDSSFLLDAPGP
ncbi:hypothetical protein [Luteimonas cucumeris]|uniref:hypothetical protein n=1 Tax=Luteimonas cucumeris TaxID=985012 RepID=UPI0011AA1FF2|nr:hypothetical protein [Luteimonas cucumeris]